MGYAERNNPNSEWNKKRNSTNFAQAVQTLTPPKGESMVVEINRKNIFAFFKDFLCRILNPFKAKPIPVSLAPTS